MKNRKSQKCKTRLPLKLNVVVLATLVVRRTVEDLVSGEIQNQFWSLSFFVSSVSVSFGAEDSWGSKKDSKFSPTWTS